MQARNWVRIALCGWVTGVIWFSILAVTIGFAQRLLPKELVDLIEKGGPHTRWNPGVLFGIDLIMGASAI